MQNKSITKQNKLVAFVCILVYCVITLIRVLNHTPFYDEAHAWTIAQQLNFVDMFNYTKNEGHFFVWQTLLYPFAHSNIISYPYPMQILNWTFCTIAIILLWWKAPFNSLIKALITFSFPFLGCYSILARCYSIGIMLLFILATMFDKKTQYPKTYALLLVLCANTSVMALIGATAFGILFLIDLYKNKLDKKNNILVGSILLLGAILILYQVCCIDKFSEIVENGHLYTTLEMFKNTYFYHNLLLNSLLNLLFLIFVLIYLFKNKSSLFILSFAYSFFIILCFGFYGVNFWHAYFLYIYLIIAMWLADIKIETRKIKIVALSILGFISFILVFHYPENYISSKIYSSNANNIIISSIIEKDDILNKSVIIHNSGELYEILPYTNKRNYKIKNYCSIEENTDYNLFSTIQGDCVRGNIFGQIQKYPEIIKELVKKYETVYAYTRKSKNPNVNNYGIIKADNYLLYIEKYKCFDDYCFWKVELK